MGMENEIEKNNLKRTDGKDTTKSGKSMVIGGPKPPQRRYDQTGLYKRQPRISQANSQIKKAKVISVISGKGGTGKSLFTAVLGNCLSKEHCKVLLVDLDIHVRGLTILLSKYIGAAEGMSVTDCLENNDYPCNFAIYRFQECEILPAVINIAHPLIKDIESSAFDQFLERLFDYAKNKYDVILLDCRSGLDDSLVTIAKKSDFVVSISEDDDVCLQANLNLVTYLRHDEKIDNIYTVINKGRRISSKDDMQKKIESIFDFSCIGLIPFDETIMEDYGKDRFWLTVYDTLYFYGIVKFWNEFRGKASISFSISEDKYFFDDTKIVRNGMSSMFRVYGFIILIAGLVFSIIASFVDVQSQNIVFLASIVSMLGLLMLVFSSRKFRSILLGRDDVPKKKQKY